MAYNNPTPEIYRGDIFYIMQGSYVGSEQKSGRPGIIVPNDLANRYSPNVEVVFLTSQEKKPMPTHVPVQCKVPSTALCENIQTVSKERLDGFVRSCTTEEMKQIDSALLYSLGIRSASVEEAPQQAANTPDPKADIQCREETERDLYKNLYEQLLERVMNK